MELLAGDRLGKYEVVGRLAAGGMAEVYLAKILGHAGFAKPVALKRMLPSLASEPGFRAMFMQEAAMAARLNHPHIVQIFDFAEERGELYLAMEFVHGVNLRKLHADALSRGAADPAFRMPPLLAAHLARCVARALGYAWTAPDERGSPLRLIHRDVSPHNILLSHQGDVKLADFGIAKPAGLQTSVGVLKGKLLYMAPEQLAGGELDARTDVFALGIVLYETALRRQQGLFYSPHEAETRHAVCKRFIPPPTRMEPDFPPRLSATIMKALERDPSRRFQSAAEMADALGEALHHEAKSPLEYDLAAYMRRLYGDPPPIRGLSSARPPPLAVSASELDRVAEDGSAATLARAQVEAQMAAAVPEAPAARASGRSTVRERRRDLLGAPGAVEPSTSAAPTRRNLRVTGRAVGALAALGLLATVGAIAARSTTAASPPEERAAGAPSLSSPEPSPPAAASGDAGEGAARVPTRVEPPARIAVSGGAPEASTGTAPAPARPDAGEGLSAAAGAGEPQARDPGPSTAPAPVRAIAGSRESASASTGPRPRPPSGSSATRPAARPPRGTGVLVVHIRPWANAWLDSERFTGAADQEAAPRLVREVPAGRHLVHLRDGAGRKRTLEVVIRPDRETAIEGELERLTVR